jgi:hypothetical protein
MQSGIVLGALIAIISAFIGSLLTRLADRLWKLVDERIAAPPHRFKLPLSINYDIVEPLANFKCNVVRFGSQKFFDDHPEGRKDVKTLERDIRRVKLKRRKDGTTELSFSLPIHAYLTQFKLFAEIKKPNDKEAFETLHQEFKNSCRDELTEITPVEGFQIWLLLNTRIFTMFHEVEDFGFKNNLANKLRLDFPVRRTPS